MSSVVRRWCRRGRPAARSAARSSPPGRRSFRPAGCKSRRSGTRRQKRSPCRTCRTDTVPGTGRKKKQMKYFASLQLLYSWEKEVVKGKPSRDNKAGIISTVYLPKPNQVEINASWVVL